MASEDPLLTLAQSLSSSGDHAGAARALQRMADEARRGGDLARAADVLDFVWREWWSAAQVKAAHDALVERLGLLRTVEDWHGVASTLVGMAFFPVLDPAKGAYFDEARRLAAEYGFTDVQSEIRSREGLVRSAGMRIGDILGTRDR